MHEEDDPSANDSSNKIEDPIDEQHAREKISEILRQVSQICEQDWETAYHAALPLLRQASALARRLNDKTPYVLCLNQIAWIHGMSNHEDQAHKTIQHSLEIAEDSSVNESVRLRTSSQFVDLSLRTKQEPLRAYNYALALLQTALDKSENVSTENWEEFIESILKLAAVVDELQEKPKSSFALLSWLHDILCSEKREEFYKLQEICERQTFRFSSHVRDDVVQEVNENRESYLREITKGLLPDHQPLWVDAIIPSQP